MATMKYGRYVLVDETRGSIVWYESDKTANEDGARKTSAEFLATMVRCCGDYWQDIFVAGTVIP